MPVWYRRAMKKPKPSQDNMQRTALFFRPEQIEKLQALSDFTGAPVAELVRRAVDAYLQMRADDIKPKGR